MAQRIEPQMIFGDTSQGIVQKVRNTLAPPNSVENSVNVVFDEYLGESVVRKGCTLVGSQLIAFDTTINGLYNFYPSNHTNAKLLAVSNLADNSKGVIYYLNGANWTSALSTDTASLKTRFATFLDVVVRMNGTDTVLGSTDGITWAENLALDTTHFPKGKFVKVYKDQMTTAGVATKPSSLYISSVPNANGTAISWTSGNREIVVNPEDGQEITGLGTVSGVEIIFKDHSMYRWNNRSVEAEPLVTVGCLSQESVANCGGGILSFFNEKGIWITTGEQPILISRRIQKWIDGMSSSFYSNVSAFGDEEHLYMSLGDCTVDGKTYQNVVARYSLNTKEFAVFSYANEFRRFTGYQDGTDYKIVGGDTTNRVLQIESSSTTDNGTAISFEIVSHEQDFGSRGVLKQLNERIEAYGINPNGALVLVSIDGGAYTSIGQMKKEIESLVIKKSTEGHYYKFKIAGVSKDKRPRIQGLEIPKVTLVDYQS